MGKNRTKKNLYMKKGEKHNRLTALEDAYKWWKRNNNHLLTVFKETKTLIEWSEDKRCKVDYRCLRQRIRYKWSPERAITTKSQRKHK